MKLDYMSYFYITMISVAFIILFTSKTFDTTIIKGNEVVIGIIAVICIFLVIVPRVMYTFTKN
jgi:hypothetical protein